MFLIPHPFPLGFSLVLSHTPPACGGAINFCAVGHIVFSVGLDDVVVSGIDEIARIEGLLLNSLSLTEIKN